MSDTFIGREATVLSLGSINADFQLRVDELIHEGTILGRDLLRAPGGKAANTAFLAARLGAPSLLIGAVGDDDLGTQALRGPIDAGVDVSAVQRVDATTGFSCVVVRSDSEKAIYLVPGANESWNDGEHHVADVVCAAAPGSVLVADLEIPDSVAAAALRAARSASLVTVVDPAPAARFGAELFRLTDHVTPDHREAAEITGLDTATPEGAAEAARWLCDRGVGAAYVKLEHGGCAVATGSRDALVIAPDDVPVTDLTGAGDAFAGALAWALFGGLDVVDAASVAVAAATCAVSTYGSQASYPTRDELDDMRKRVKVR